MHAEGVPLTVDELRARWKRNAEAAGVRLTDDDIARIDERGFLARVAAVEQMIEATNAVERTPDYLDILHTGTREGDNG